MDPNRFTSLILHRGSRKDLAKILGVFKAYDKRNFIGKYMRIKVNISASLQPSLTLV